MNKNTSIAASLARRDYFLTESDFHTQLFEDIESIIKSMESSRDKYFCDDEDKLSHTIVSSLGFLGYGATEQTKKNGSVDILVTTNTENNKKFEWVAEAKIGYGYQNIFEGLLQLLTRYVSRDNSGGLFVYYQKAKSNTLFNNWLKYLYNKEWIDYCVSQKTIDDIMPMIGHFTLSQYKKVKDDCYYADLNIEKPNGAGFCVKCFYVDVYHKPLDKSGVNNKSLREGLARNTLKDMYKLWETDDFNHTHYKDLFEALKVHFGGALDD
ncbi:hypothetical protein I5393_05680 [Citrobacter freundii]|uniref:hypothetical protein n=1 Tax=Citrobacter freundii TaxID=546 RepID=UPI0018FF3694|nr:hypothetical protein [Citrobacter freundii]MBJ8767874.1 hypothetical protein [Citrobacter freundii]